jgi:hypothetical protein
VYLFKSKTDYSMGSTCRPSISSRPGRHVRGHLPCAGHAWCGRQLPPMPPATLSLPVSKHSRWAPPSQLHSLDSFPTLIAPSLHGPNATTSTVQIPNRIWIKNSWSKSNLKLVCILKGFKPLRNFFINSPKIFLDIIFNTVNLDWCTCILKFKVPLQVENMT